MRFKQLDEAIVKVPPELMNKVNLYTSSALASLYNIALENSAKYMKEEQFNELKLKIERVIGKLQSQYGAKVLSRESLDSILNKVIELPFDAQKMLAQTNINVNSDSAHNVNNSKIYLELTTSGGREYQGQMSSMHTGDKIISIVLNANLTQPLKTVNSVMSTANHEAQHVIQELMIRDVEKSGKTVQSGDNTPEGYYSSYIEFGPHLASIAGAIENVLELMKLNDSYPANAQEGFKLVFETAVKREPSFMRFIKEVKEKDEARYKKAIKQINKSYYELYDKIKNTDVNYAYSSLKNEELNARVDTMLSIYYVIRNHKNFRLLTAKVNSENKSELTVLKCTLFDVILLTFYKAKDNKINFHFKYGHFEESASLDTKDMLGFMNSCQYVPEGDIDHVLSILRTAITSAGSSISTEDVTKMIDSVSNIINFYETVNVSKENDNITISGINFKINPTEEQKTVIIESDEIPSLYFNVTLQQAENFFLVFARCSADTIEMNDPEIMQDAMKVLKNEISFMIIMDKLGDLVE